MLELHALLRRPLGAGSAVSDPLIREAGPGNPLRRSNNADIPRFSSTPLLGLTRPSQIPPKEKPPGVLLDAQKMLGPRAPLRRPSWDWLSRLKFLPERSPRGPSSTLRKCLDSALFFNVPPGPDSAFSNSSLREATGGPLRRPKNAGTPRPSSTPLFGLARPSQILPGKKPPGSL